MTQNEFKIEKSVEIPQNKYMKKPNYPLADMDVGDSFFIKIEQEENELNIKNKIYSAITQCKRKSGRDYTARRVDGGYRVWRVK